MVIRCGVCGKDAFKTTSHYNRAVKLGAGMFCSRWCAHEHRRVHKTAEVKKEEKRLYDMAYREKNRDGLLAEKRAYYQRTKERDKEKHKLYRISRRERHNEYCRRPEYKAKKHIYDRERYAKEKFGEYWESHVAIMAIDEQVKKVTTKYEIRLKNKTLNKALQRSRNGETKRSYA